MSVAPARCGLDAGACVLLRGRDLRIALRHPGGVRGARRARAV